MTKWEYRRFSFSDRFISDQFLNEIGQEGWEAYHIKFDSHSDKSNLASGTIFIYAKRPIIKKMITEINCPDCGSIFKVQYEDDATLKVSYLKHLT